MQMRPLNAIIRQKLASYDGHLSQNEKLINKRKNKRRLQQLSNLKSKLVELAHLLNITSTLDTWIERSQQELFFNAFAVLHGGRSFSFGM